MKKITIFTFIFLSLYSHSCKALQEALLGLEVNKSFFVSSEGIDLSRSVVASDYEGDDSEVSSLVSSIHSFVAVDEDPDWEKIPKNEDQQRQKREGKKFKQIFNLSPVNKQTKEVTQSSEKKDPLPTDSFPRFLDALVDVKGVKQDFKEVGYFLFQAAQNLLGGLVEKD